MTDATALPLREVVAAVHRRYPPGTAMAWDAVGLVCGDPDQPVRRIHLAVDPVAATVEEALDAGADLLITHHPLLLTPLTSVAALTPHGRLLHRLVRGGCALLAVHTNGDVARDGVSDALAAALGVRATTPVEPDPGDPATGLGRVGDLDEATTLGAFAAHVRDSLPATAHGVRIAGDPERAVRRVAVIGGSGSDAIEAAALAGADAVVTADLKHHTAGDALAEGGPALLDVAHWASEWPWLGLLRERLVSDLAGLGVTVDTHVSTIVTDPWTARL
ncbi:MAG: Nif3-like dinuclear metal center hexameric protein [Candidatus Nanopelagicales bacterium]